MAKAQSFRRLCNACVRLDAIAAMAVLLALAVAGSGGMSRARSQTAERAHGREAIPLANPPQARSADQRTADVIVNEIDTLVKTTRRPMLQDDFVATHNKIATLVNELRTSRPDDPLVSRYLPERWMSLSFLNRRAEVYPEIRAVLATTVDPVLRKDALFIETSFRLMEPIDESAALSLAEAFIREAPGDNRAAGFLHMAAKRFEPGWITRLSIIGIFVLAGVLTLIGVRKHFASACRCLKLAARPAGLVLLVSVAALCIFRMLSADTFAALVGSLNDKLTDSAMRQRLIFIATMLLYQVWHDLHAIATSGRMVGGLALAAATGVVLGVVGSRSARMTMHWPSPVRLGIVGFCGILAVCLVIDGCLVTRRRDVLLERMVGEYPDSFWGRLVQGERRQKDRLGETFELEFTDAITGRHVSMKGLRGKIVVVDFWATWCGPCVAEIPKMLRIYSEYHDKGVEFIGVSHDVSEADGGLEALRTFVKARQIPWPHYFQGKDNQGVVTGTPTNDFSESWGISGIPTVFLIDAEGKLFSTEARGKLDALIPQLLEKAGSTGH